MPVLPMIHSHMELPSLTAFWLVSLEGAECQVGNQNDFYSVKKRRHRRTEKQRLEPQKNIPQQGRQPMSPFSQWSNLRGASSVYEWRKYQSKRESELPKISHRELKPEYPHSYLRILSWHGRPFPWRALKDITNNNNIP